MEFCYVGKIVNTHGLKGEIRILADIFYKDKVFCPGKTFYIGSDYQPYKVLSYRPHKNYDMVMLENITTIEDATTLKGENVYVAREELPENLLFYEDYIGLDVFQNKRYVGKVVDMVDSKLYSLLQIQLDQKTFYVPNIPEFVLKIDRRQQQIEIVEMVGLCDEN